MLESIPWYTYEFKAYTKERWIGRELVDVLSSEFTRRLPVYFRKAVQAGSVKVNGKAVHEEYKLSSGDLITHTTHRHEPPIPTNKIRIVFDSPEILAVDKPSGIPCHPNSSYNKNSLSEMIKVQHNLKFVSVLNRLDKQTSGLVLLAKTPEAAAEYHKRIEEKEGFKIYLCRVRGIFPNRLVIVSLPLSISRRTCTTTVHEKDRVLQGKKSITIFRKIGEEGESSILACGLVTGRTHQIRVHLQAIGYPIVDDMMYSQPYIRPDVLVEYARNTEKDRRNEQDAQNEQNNPNEQNKPSEPSEPSEPNEKNVSNNSSAYPHCPVEITESVYLEMIRRMNISLSAKDVGRFVSTEECRSDRFQDDPEYISSLSTDDCGQFIMESCMHCRNISTLSDMPKFSSLSLHAWKYTFNLHTFKTLSPEWTACRVDDSVCAEIEDIKKKIVLDGHLSYKE